VLRAIHLNPHFLELVESRISRFDEFLNLHEIKYNSSFLKKLRIVRNPKEVIEKALEIRINALEQ